jgi:SAM-dependent methyltransferase
VTAKTWRQTLNYALGRWNPHWLRVVMNLETERFLDSIHSERLDVLEVSGDDWSGRRFGSYTRSRYPEFDVCAGPLALERWDVVIIEQVLEHVLEPERAIVNAYAMLRPGGWLVVTTPFLVRVHRDATGYDCSRWTETGMAQLLTRSGFLAENIRTGSWGNRSCVIANLDHWVTYKPLWHSLENDPRYPLQVWAFAMKPTAAVPSGQ